MTYFVGAYWGARVESRPVCARRLLGFLHGMAEQDPTLSRWFKRTSSRKASLVELPRDPDKLGLLLKTNSRDIGGDAIAELGFNFAAWTGRDVGTIAHFTMTCGAYCPAIRNSVVVSFDPMSEMLTSELLHGILKAVVAAFDPEDAVVSSIESLAAHATLLPWQVPAMFRYRQGSGFAIG